MKRSCRLLVSLTMARAAAVVAPQTSCVTETVANLAPSVGNRKTIGIR